MLLATPAIRNLVRDEKVHQIYSQTQVGQSDTGMQTMSRALVALVERGIITADDAVMRATEPDELRHLLAAPSRATGEHRAR